MGTITSRSRRAGLGLSLFLLLALCAWEVAGRVTPRLAPTPLAVLSAAWTLATAGAPPAAPAAAPDERQARLAFRPLPYVMYGLKPDWTREPQARHDGTMVMRSSNSFGFRGREIVQPKPPGRLRIVCLGGSTTYSDAVSDDDAYPVLLEHELRAERPGRDIEVVNAGVPSYTTAETLASLAFRCLDLSPDVIVLYEGINDYRTRVYANFDSAYFHYRRVWNGSAEPPAHGEGELADGINALIQLELPRPNGNKLANVQRSGTAAFRRNLVSIAGIARAHGVRVVFVSCAYDVGNPYADAPMTDAFAEHNRVVKEVALQEGAPFIDLAASFRTEGQFVDVVHMNAQGSAQMARLIAAGMLATLP